jgi:AcrR family transcriptional regulator
MNVKRAKRLSRSETAAQTRTRLLDAGARVFAGEGFFRATVEDIAEAAGYTRGAFYAHFVDKADLLLTLLEERDRAGLDDLEARLAAQPDEAQIDATTSWFGERFTMPSALDQAVAEFGSGGIANPEHAARMRRWIGTARQRVTTMVADGFSRAGEDVPGDPERFATMLVALVNGFAMLQRLDPESATAELFGDAVTYLGEGALAAAARG